MKKSIAFALAIVTISAGLAALVSAESRNDRESPIYGVRLPEGYRDWKLISVAQENGQNNDIRAILGNDIAIKAYREKLRPFPDGAVIARLAWRYESSPRNDAVFPSPQSFVAGPPTNVQVSVKDSKRYPATAGWGYGQFENGLPTKNPAVLQSCFACHSKLQKLEANADYVFTDYSH